jgi:hypothetical protein
MQNVRVPVAWIDGMTRVAPAALSGKYGTGGMPGCVGIASSAVTRRLRLNIDRGRFNMPNSAESFVVEIKLEEVLYFSP